jgi:Rps23 Pro-64 3,4-dihydroxylase Tpa1-like proline 4-hydroxylase
MIEHRLIKCENQKEIHIFDNIFPLEFRQKSYNFCRDSFFKIGWSDIIIPERKSYDYFLHSTYSQEDLNNLGIMTHLVGTPIMDLVSGLSFSKAVLNLSVPSDVNYVHAHYEKKVILYYVNMEWREGWHGETLFYTEDLKNMQFATPYIPGRIIVFDGNIPHTIRPQSTIAAHHRLTLALIYDDKK